MRLPFRTRTSLFARMSLLFGLLVTMPLVISGIVLSFAGSQSVHQSGHEVAEIGHQTLTNTGQRFRETARRSLDSAASNIARTGGARLEASLHRAVDVGKAELQRDTERMSERGRQAVGRVSRQMVRVGQEKLQSSLGRLRDLNRDSLAALSSRFSRQMETELDTSASTVQKTLEATVIQSWEATADRRLLRVTEYLARAVSEMVLRLQLPLRLHAIVTGDETEAPAILARLAGRADPASPEVVRVVLVSSTGTEWARVPESDLPPGSEGEDWAESPTRQALLAQKDPVLVEPVRYDERSKRWLVRVAHRVVRTDFVLPPGATAAAMAKLPPTPFLVVDLALEDLADLATPEPLSGALQILVLQGETGRVISSAPRRPDAALKGIADALPPGPEAEGYRAKPFEFRYTAADGTLHHGRARYWGNESDVWSVVTQPDAEVRRQVTELEARIRQAWSGALKKVTGATSGLINERGAIAEGIQKRLVAEARAEMAEEEERLQRQVREDLQRYQRGLASEIEKELTQATLALQKGGVQAMSDQAKGQARDAVLKMRQAALRETELASRDIEVRSRVVASRTAGQMLLNSAFLIPLFLILALFLATLTARSLTRPIDQLVRATHSLAAGQYHERIPVRGDDELARLATAFNDMASAIERGQADLRQSHDSLAAEKARIEAIVESSPDGLVMMGPEGDVAIINPTAVRLLGLTRREVPEAPFGISQLPGFAARRLGEALERAASGEGAQEYEIAEPHRLVLQVRDVRLPPAAARSWGRLLHMRDVTRERIVDEMKSDFISLVSHELRTPLTSILGFSSYLLTGRLGRVNDTQRLALESVHRQSRRLSAIISDFLDISRIESGRIEMKKEPVAVAHVASRVVEDLRPQAAEKSICVETRTEDPPEALVALGDEQRIVQVLTNLLGNALKFTDREGRVEVLLARQNGDLLCRVRDTGCGIPPEELDRVFDRFYQVEKVVTRKTGGTGLGLAIVKNIVEAHGGQVWIESEVGAGTQVSFTLPAGEC